MYRELFIRSVMPLWPVSEDCGKCPVPTTACGPSYDHVADVSKFAGIENLAEGRNDVIIFSGDYFHCGQSMQKAASSGIRMDSPAAGEEELGTSSVYIENRVLECPCGFRLMPPG